MCVCAIDSSGWHSGPPGLVLILRETLMNGCLMSSWACYITHFACGAHIRFTWELQETTESFGSPEDCCFVMGLNVSSSRLVKDLIRHKCCEICRIESSWETSKLCLALPLWKGKYQTSFCRSIDIRQTKIP